MSQASKNLKICCFATILAGLAAIVFGIVRMVGGPGLDTALPLLSGCCATALGFWAARAANVPANAASIVRAGVIVALLCVVATAAHLAFGEWEDVGTLAATGAPAACAATTCIGANKVKSELEQRR